MWGLVLLRLLVPFAPASPVSLQNMLPAEQSEPDAPRDRTLQSPLDAELQGGYSAAPRPGLASETDLARSAAPMATAPGAIDWIADRLPWIWLTGAAATLVWTLLAHWQLCRRLKRLAPCDDQRVCGLWEACCREAGVRRNLRIANFEGLQQPAVAGLFRPQLLLPDDAAVLDDRQLRMIMLHELAHVRRWHVAANWRWRSSVRFTGGIRFSGSQRPVFTVCENSLAMPSRFSVLKGGPRATTANCC